MHAFTRSGLACVVAFAPLLHAAEPPAGADARAEAARAIIEDLGRIVAPNGVQETFKLRIGGIEQWVYARGQDRSNPVIVFVHGGPASPMSAAMWMFQRPLEEYFTVVNWDQRGAGRTFRETEPDSIADTIRIDRYVDDTIELAQHLRKRYGVRKLILVGHSWGTVVGMKAALERPQLFHAYVGIGQVINTQDNERLSFEYGLAQAKKHRNAEAIRELESIAPYPGDQPITRDRIIIARKWPQFYGGLTAFRDSSDYYFNAAKLSPEYSATDAAAIDKGSLFTLGRILPEFLEVDFTPVKAFPIPVVMFMGRHDYTTPSQPTDEWLRKVKAPFKLGIWFEQSAHMIPFEEPGKLLLSLVEHVRPLALEGAGAGTH
jgi:pimeloyl-ACP methyl ester carboxylesterase